MRRPTCPLLVASLVSFAVALGGCGGMIAECEPVGELEPICGFQRPEDLIALPNGNVLVSEMGHLRERSPGFVGVLDPATDRYERLYPPSDGEADVAAAPQSGWGDPDCVAAAGAAISPHGLSLSTRSDGLQQVLVVNHGGRESIEYFQLRSEAGRHALEWRGCVLLDGYNINSVAALADGGFVATHMFGSTFDSLKAMVFGSDSGHVIRWSPAAGIEKLADSEGSGPNGIVVSPDGRYVFFAMSMGDEIRRLALDGSEPAARIAIPVPDNLRYSPDGRLLVASQRASIVRCMSDEEGSCPTAFAIVELDPETLETRDLFASEGPPMGAGTVGLALGDSLLIGSFKGDRILRAPLPE